MIVPSFMFLCSEYCDLITEDLSDMSDIAEDQEDLQQAIAQSLHDIK